MGSQSDQMAWEVEPEKKKRAVPTWSSSVPSEPVTVHSHQANGKGRDVQAVWRTVQERSEGKTDNRAQVQDAQLEWAMSRFCPLETMRL